MICHSMTSAALVGAMAWTDASTVLAVVTGLVVVPLGVITFYLRSLLTQQAAGRADVTRRFEHVEAAIRRLARRVGEHERDFTAKEDWLRESMLARRNIERLTEAFARIDAGLDAALHRAHAPTCARCGPGARERHVGATHRAGMAGEKETD